MSTTVHIKRADRIPPKTIIRKPRKALLGVEIELRKQKRLAKFAESRGLGANDRWDKQVGKLMPGFVLLLTSLLVRHRLWDLPK